MKEIELTDGIITLKPFRIEDAETHFKGEDIEQQKWLSGGKSTVETVKKWIKKNREYWEKGGSVFNFAIWDVKDNELIGMIEANADYNNVEGLEKGDANISYGLYPRARGKGYMVKAINLIQPFLKEKWLQRAVIRVNPQNTNSLKLPLKCGFKEIKSIKTQKGEELIIFIKNL